MNHECGSLTAIAHARVADADNYRRGYQSCQYAQYYPCRLLVVSGFAGIAGFYLYLDAQFLAAIQVLIIYRCYSGIDYFCGDINAKC